MTVSRAEIEHVAALAALHLDDDALTALTRQLGAILEYVAQLEGAALDRDEPFRPGPARAPLRDDVVAPRPMTGGVADIAPQATDAFVLVPEIGGGAGGT